jgi:acyl-[acyl-carrier-protein]-phospholipid O-acyltransferase/long-chain-fatty-acid--[acyl-carrier-protein] ligase
MKRLVRWCLRWLFRYRVHGKEVLRTPGPVLLIPNHVSWLDWIFLVVLLEDDWKFVVSSVVARSSWLHRKIMLNRRTFPIDPTSPYAVKRMAEHLHADGRLVLFAEGRISSTGGLMKLYDGTGFLLLKTAARVITCYLRGAERHQLSRQPGWRRWFPRVSAHFSEALQPPRFEGLSTAQARTKLTVWLRDQMVEQQFHVEMAFGPAHLAEAVVAAARPQLGKVALEDLTRVGLTYRRLLVGADLLGNALRARLDPEPGQRVGILLPNVNALPLVLLSLWDLGHVPAILNFSTGTSVMAACVRLAGLRRIVTSRAFLERARLDVNALRDAGVELLFLEDVRAAIPPRARWGALWRTQTRVWRSHRTAAGTQAADNPAVVLFTSGSEGMPKAVELTHRNLLANVRQMLALVDLVDTDRVFNALPLFHSFGLTAGLLMPLVRGLFVFLYPSPLHYRVVPTAVYETSATVFFGTNTFLAGYARKAHAYDFRNLRFLIAGAEKVQEATAQLWAQRFGVRILEGYGATECSPVISANTPLAPRPGSVGRLVPGMEHRIEPVAGVSEGGRLWVRGPNVMRGYLNPEAQAGFAAGGGWYDTGDIVKVDADGFLFILGRLKRFAKVSGEMISLTAVEDALAGVFPHYGLRCTVAVLSRPDEDKGEALIAVSNEARLGLDEVRAALKAKGFSNLCVPREIRAVREIPRLGSGKVNHRELQAQVLA